jgi:hypothetical protein
MGWAGPANWARLSHRNGWADFRPEMVGPISARNGWAELGPTLFIYFFRAGPNPAQKFGLGQIRPGPTPTA